MDASVDQVGTAPTPAADAVKAPGSKPESAVPAGTDVVEASEGILIVEDHRVRFQYTGSNDLVDLPTSQIRRVQVDFELGRPATVVIVPNSGTLDVRSLTVERAQYEQLGAAMVHLAVDISDGDGK